MENLNLKPEFVKELELQLPTLKCDNPECEANLTPVSHMYFITFSAHQPTTFKVDDNKVCCKSFKIKLEKETDIIYQKLKGK